MIDHTTVLWRYADAKARFAPRHPRSMHILINAINDRSSR